MTDDINKKLDYLNETKQLIRAAIEEKGPVITDEDTLRSYVDKIKNIESLDPNTAKVFTSIEEMNQDDKVFIGKKAIVYNRDMMPLNRETSVTNIDIPQSFTLSEIPTSSFSASYRSNVSASNEYLQLNLNDTQATLSYEYNDSSNHTYLQYVWVKDSENIYQNTQAQGTTQGASLFGITEFKNILTYYSGSWSDLFGEIFKANQSEFHGVYEYTDKYEDTSYFNTFNNFKQVAYVEDDVTKYKIEYNTVPLNMADIRNKINTILTNLNLDYTSYYGLGMVTEYENNIPKILEFYEDAQVYVDGTKVKISKANYTSEPSSLPTCTKFIFNLITMEVSSEIVSTVLETRLIGTTTHYIAVVKDYPNNIGSFQGYITTTGAFAARTYFYKHTGDGIITSTDSNIYYFRPRYVSAPNQLSNLLVKELFENEVVYAKNGIVKGDKSYLKNIKNKDFYNTWLPEEKLNYADKNYTSVLNAGKYVPLQTFVERNQILGKDVKNQDLNNCITQHNVKLNLTETTLASNDILTKIFGSHQYYSSYYRYNETVYWYALGINWSNTDTHEYVNSIYGAVYNAETGEKVCDMSDTTSWKPIDPNYYGTMEYFCGVCHATFAHERNEFVILFDTGSWGWSHGAYTATYKYNALTKARTAKTSINVGKHGTGSYYQIDLGTYDPTYNCFYGLIQSFDEGGDNSKNQYIIKLDSSNNATVIYSDTSSNYALYNYSWWTSTSPDRYSLYPYIRDNVLKIINLNNGKVLSINNVSSSLTTENIVKYNNEIYISYYTIVESNRTHFVDKLNLTNMTKTNILTYESNNEYFGFIHVNDQLCVRSSTTYKIFTLQSEELQSLKGINTPIILGISGLNVIDDQTLSEAYYIYVSTGTNKVFTKYKLAYNYYVYKEIESYPIQGELFIVGSGTSNSTKYETTNMHYSYQLTEQKVDAYQYQKYLDSIDQLLYENEVEE